MRISGGNAGNNMFRGSVKSTGYPLHSTVSPSLPLPCVTVCHHISTRLYAFQLLNCKQIQYEFSEPCTAVQSKSFLSRDIMLRRLVVNYRRFGTTCRSLLQGASSPRRIYFFWKKIGPIYFPETSLTANVRCVPSQ